MIDDDFNGADDTGRREGREARFRLGRDQSPSVSIIRAIAAVTGTEPERLPPLQGYLDTDALNTLLRGARDGRPADVRISFEYEHVEVTVDSDGRIEVLPRGRRDGRTSSERLGR